MGVETIHLQSHHKSLKVCIEGGTMDYNVPVGRPPRVLKQPTFIAFKAGAAKVDLSSPRVPSNPWKDCDWDDLGAKNRGAAVAALRRVNGYGTDFTIVDATVEADVRASVAAGTK